MFAEVCQEFCPRGGWGGVGGKGGGWVRGCLLLRGDVCLCIHVIYSLGSCDTCRPLRGHHGSRLLPPHACFSRGRRETYSTTRFHSHDFQSCRNDHPLVFVVRCRHPLKTLHSIQGCLSSVLLVGQHTFKLQLRTIKTIKNILIMITYITN